MPRGDRRRAQEEKRKAEEAEARLVSEAAGWICDNSINSYYEFKLHCFKNRPEWLPLLRGRNNRLFFSTLTRDIKRTKNKKYARPLSEVMQELAAVEDAYYKARQEAMIKEMERIQEEYEAEMFPESPRKNDG